MAGALRQGAGATPPGLRSPGASRTSPKPLWTNSDAWADRYGELQPTVRISKPALIIQRALSRQLGTETLRGEGVHTVRRSVARILFDQASEHGHDNALRVAAALLGHSSTQTTEIYLGIDRDRQKRDEILRGKSLFPPSRGTSCRRVRPGELLVLLDQSFA